MESEATSEMTKTKSFNYLYTDIIYNRCRKDHFNYVNDLPVKKQRSLYENEIC